MCRKIIFGVSNETKSFGDCPNWYGGKCFERNKTATETMHSLEGKEWLIIHGDCVHTPPGGMEYLRAARNVFFACDNVADPHSFPLNVSAVARNGAAKKYYPFLITCVEARNFSAISQPVAVSFALPPRCYQRQQLKRTSRVNICNFIAVAFQVSRKLGLHRRSSGFFSSKLKLCLPSSTVTVLPIILHSCGRQVASQNPLIVR